MSDEIPRAYRLRSLPLEVRRRLAFLEGAAEAWREGNGEELAPDALARIVPRYPGDPDAVAARREDER